MNEDSKVLVGMSVEGQGGGGSVGDVAGCGDAAGGVGNGRSAAQADRPDPERFFRMGAAVAVAGLVHSGEMNRNSTLRKWAKGYLASFGISSLRDVADLGIDGVYKYDFETLLA